MANPLSQINSQEVQSTLPDHLKKEGTSVLVVYNPYSGEHQAERLKNLLYKKLRHSFDRVDVHRTKSLQDATACAMHAVYKGYHSIFVIGGDGTVRSVIKGLIEGTDEDRKRPILGVIPAGTFNGFAQALNMPNFGRLAIKLLQLNRTCEMDIGLCNQTVFCLAFAMSCMSEAVHNATVSDKEKIGFFAYVLQWFKERSKKRLFQLEIQTEQTRIKGKYRHVFVLLSGRFARLKFVPHAQLKEGRYLHLFLIENMNIFRKLWLFLKLLFRRSHTHPNVNYIHAKNIRITGKVLYPTDVDGDKGPSLPLTLSLVSRAIRCYCLGMPS